MCYISMDLSRQALQTNGKLFFFISNWLKKIKIIVALGINSCVEGEAFVLTSTRFSCTIYFAVDGTFQNRFSPSVLRSSNE